MRRRTLLKIAALSGITMRGAFPLQVLASVPDVAAPGAHTVLVVTKCHLDVGFSTTQVKVIRKYFDVYFPEAIRIATELRSSGTNRYTWTTGSWLLYQYLEQASPAQRRVMDEAIAAGDIDWHALPFNWQTEMIDRSMLEGALSFSSSLDIRFGHRTIGAKMTDVPGHSRGIIAPLSAAGIRLLDIGVNAASTPPNVPDVFLWKNPAGESLSVLYHRHDYGGIIEIPGTGVAVDVEVRSDNSGPHTPEEIAAIYAKLRARFPGAQIKASNMSEVALAVDAVRSQLPIVTSEIGDTWIYGCSSDPYKISRYREFGHVFASSGITGGSFSAGDVTDRNLLQHLLLAPEHTWGTDTKTYLDYDHYRPTDLEKVLGEPSYKVMELSWKEKRDDIDEGLATLPPGLRSQAATTLASLAPVQPSIEVWRRILLGQPSIRSTLFSPSIRPPVRSLVFVVMPAVASGPLSSIHWPSLLTRPSRRRTTPLPRALCDITADWAPRDFGKPGIANFHAASEEWHPRILSCWLAKQPLEIELCCNSKLKTRRRPRPETLLGRNRCFSKFSCLRISHISISPYRRFKRPRTACPRPCGSPLHRKTRWRRMETAEGRSNHRSARRDCGWQSSNARDLGSRSLSGPGWSEVCAPNS